MEGKGYAKKDTYPQKQSMHLASGKMLRPVKVFRKQCEHCHEIVLYRLAIISLPFINGSTTIPCNTVLAVSTRSLGAGHTCFTHCDLATLSYV